MHRALLISLSAILLCFWAFHNGFPFVFPDTGTYLHSGFDNWVPTDRPIFYGLFVRHISLEDSLYLVIFVQGLILSTLIYYWFKYFGNGKNISSWQLLLILIISIFTGAGVNVSQLIPDIFASVLLLSIGLLLLAPALKGWRLWLVCSFTILGIAVHTSHGLIALIIILLCSLSYLIRPIRQALPSAKFYFKRIGISFALVLFSLLALTPLYVAISGAEQKTKVSEVFIMSRLMQWGLVEHYLDRNCVQNDYAICAYKDEVPVNFMWNYSSSPLYKTGGWEANQVEYNTIIKDILSRPVYWKWIIQRGLEAGLTQFFSFDIGDTTHPQPADSPAYYAVKSHYPRLKRDMQVSRQFNARLGWSFQNFMQDLLLGLALLFNILLLISKRLESNMRLLLGFLLMSLLVNAFICGGLSGIFDRYQCRVMWLLLLPLFILLSQNRLKWLDWFYTPTAPLNSK